MNPDERDDELSAGEKAQFASLPRERSPEASLEEKIVHALKARGLIAMTETTHVRPFYKIAGALAAAVMLVALGFGWGKRQNTSAPHQPAKPAFVLFLYDSGEPHEDEASLIAEYGGWARGLREAKHRISGEKLKEGGRILSNTRGQLEIHEISGAAEKQMLGGYFLIEAENYDEAVQIAAGCPHLKYGGVIELRQIDAI